MDEAVDFGTDRRGRRRPGPGDDRRRGRGIQSHLAGPAKLVLIADRQPGPNVARRNVDLVMLTSDRKQVEERIAKENYLPLDGMLTQSGDLLLRVHNATDGNELTLHVGTGKEHSPY